MTKHLQLLKLYSHHGLTVKNREWSSMLLAEWWGPEAGICYQIIVCLVMMKESMHSMIKNTERSKTSRGREWSMFFNRKLLA